MRTAINDSGYKTFKAGTNIIPLGSRVKLTAVDTIDIAGADDAAIGTAMEDIAAGGYGTIKLFSAPGTFYAKASKAITVGTQLYPDVSGKVSSTGGGAGAVILNFIALEPASADGDVILIARVEKGAQGA